ncbi:MAG TPA: LysR family transcriptional regulator [Conexibacter sp.]|jgi:DNA-binding transcriptional LysR family regulator
MPDLRQLRTFVAVAEQLSFTRAAELLHLTQQTVSKTVRELERELGVELLERTTREVRPTAPGVALLESGREVLRVADAAFAHARDVGTGVAGAIRVGVSPAIGPLDRAEAVAALRPNDSDVSISLYEVRPRDLRPMLRNREIDVALTRVSGTSEPTLHQAELRPTEMMLCLPVGHRLAEAEGTLSADGRQLPLTLAALGGERMLVPSPAGTPYTDMVLSRIAAAGVTVTTVEARVTGGTAVTTEVARQQALLLMPVGSPLAPGVTSLALDGVTLPLFVLWQAGLPSAAVRRLREAMGT